MCAIPLQQLPYLLIASITKDTGYRDFKSYLKDVIVVSNTVKQGDRSLICALPADVDACASRHKPPNLTFSLATKAASCCKMIHQHFFYCNKPSYKTPNSQLMCCFQHLLRRERGHPCPLGVRQHAQMFRRHAMLSVAVLRVCARALMRAEGARAPSRNLMPLALTSAFLLPFYFCFITYVAALFAVRCRTAS